jgi:hypothetical protein
MYFDMAGIDQQPCKIRFIYQLLQKPFPDPAVTPAAKPAVRLLPIAIVRRQIAPWGSCP